MQNAGNPVSSLEDKRNTAAAGSRKTKANTVRRKTQERGESGRRNRLHFSLFNCGVKHLLATIIAALAVTTTETITIGAGNLFILSRQVNRKLQHKATKHENNQCS